MNNYKLYNKHNLEKYDDNKDNLITLKEYIDKEVSKGPAATLVKI